MNRFIQRIDNAVCSRLLNMADSHMDKRICGQSLVKYVPSIFRDDKNGIGGTGSHWPQSYSIWIYDPKKREDTDAGNE